MLPLVLAGLAVALVWVAPGVLARRPRLRRAPRAALVAWQAVSLGGVLAALFVAPAALPLFAGEDDLGRHPVLVAVAGCVSAALIVRLLVSGHRVGTRIRAARARHREIVDIVAEHDRDGLRVLQHPTATAYCIPGRSSRVVLSQGVLDTLPEDQLAAVVAHEKAHLRARHDLLLEFFTVLHESVPSPLRSHRALTEVRLLVEALADRAAVRRSGEVATARALVAIAQSRYPDEAMGAGTSAPLRMQLLALGPQPSLAAGAYALAAAAVLTPLALLVAAWS
ncbi:M56 family metallopeptidase [Arthrobacter sp. NEB 688]|uniref:M56 family metallopeptidase n=1 Tax=Arthrobacter sp. NEB 688 TaxID=904039 RepID=UPI001563EE63|nr:M56 family metallopeptidase [Arthrobacter sp. NEB 688]QKE82988.1 M56 family metallopeptidase [Arthrobacter sp. NEB 688]